MSSITVLLASGTGLPGLVVLPPLHESMQRSQNCLGLLLNVQIARPADTCV